MAHNKSMQPTAKRRRLLVLVSAAADFNSYAHLTCKYNVFTIRDDQIRVGST